MILKASQRAHAKELAHHLLNGDANEHVTVHEVRGFVSDDVFGAFEEAYAVSRGTKCRQFLFSLSLNPPEFADLPVDAFEDAIADIEKALGLINQPRVIVFHEKNGRRHCHCVWTRVDSETMTAINMAHYKLKLNSIAKALYLKHGWDLPDGFKKDTEASKASYNREEWQQAQRLKENPEELKALLRTCWQQSDSRKGFAGALQEYGLYLAKGYKRGFVAVDYQGEVYSLSRWMKVKTKELKARLGAADTLPSVQDAQAYLEARVTDNLTQHIAAHKERAKEKRKPLVQALRRMTQEHRAARETLWQQQQERWDAETLARSQRLTRGMQGIFDRITGKYTLVRALNEQVTKECLERDKLELQALVEEQLEDRRELETSLRDYRQNEKAEALELKQHIAGFINTDTEPEVIQTPLKVINDQIATVETQIEALSNDIALLQASLENHLLSDSMRAKIRAMIERAKSALRGQYQQVVEEQKTKSVKEHEELQLRMQKFFNLAREQEQLRQKQYELQQRQYINQQLYSNASNMSYSLNGIPRYQITMQKSPQIRFEEITYTKQLRKQPPSVLLHKVEQPECAVTELRQNTLQVKELLRRHNAAPQPGNRKKGFRYSTIPKES